MSTRLTSKGIISVEKDIFLMVVNGRGMRTLLGGGNDFGESDPDAFYREAEEEIGVPRSGFSDIEKAGCVKGTTTPRTGGEQEAKWIIFKGRLLIPLTDIEIPENNDVAAITTLQRDEWLGMKYPDISDLALQALTRYA